uniref:Uncharacterized protein n=1 Tax=Heterorhabditis bacteriophora TaxID=37862 RepID=A0A1I7XTZ6_HETBA
MWARRILCEQNPSSCLMILVIDVGLILRSQTNFLISILLSRKILFLTILRMREVFTDLDLPLLGWSSTVPSSCLFTTVYPTPREQAVLFMKYAQTTSGFERLASYSSTVLENVRLLRNSLRSDRRSASSLAFAEQARYGYAFSQDEPSAMTELIRDVDSTRTKPTGL